MGLAFMTTGVAFKIAAVPFHYWTPDAYQGSPTPITGYLSVGPKIGAFALILRLFVGALDPAKTDWLVVFIVLAAHDDDPRQPRGADPEQRQADAGLQLDRPHRATCSSGWPRTPAGRSAGLQGLLYYGAAYTFMNLGAFAVVAALQRRPGVTSQLDTFAGLGRREPVLGILMTLFMLSLTGIPPTAGFFAKVSVILPAVQAGGWLTILAVIAVLNAAAAAFYYLRVVVYMFMRESTTESEPSRHSSLVWTGLWATTALTIVLGLFPGPLLSIVTDAAKAIP